MSMCVYVYVYIYREREIHTCIYQAAAGREDEGAELHLRPETVLGHATNYYYYYYYYYCYYCYYCYYYYYYYYY